MSYSYTPRCGIFPVANPNSGSLFGQQPQHSLFGQYPLVQSSCHYTVVDVNVHARLTQVYVSKASQAEEVKYVFPLPSDAAVCAFSAVIDDKRTIHGVVKKKDEAKRDYDAAIAQGKTAGLLDQHTADVFQVTLGQLKQGQKIAVNISFVSVISHDGKLDSLRLTLPLSIAPNYGTPPDTLEHYRFLRGSTAPFELTMSFSMTSNIMSVTSQTHPVGISLGLPDFESAAPFDPTKAHLTLSTSGMLDKDVVVVLKCDGLDKPRCVVERAVGQAGTSDALALTLVPRFDAPPLPSQEYIFLIDRSGSMNGARIVAVRAALQIMLRSLPARGTRVNLLSFGSRTTALWPASVEYSADSVRAAAAHVDTMRADYGGTEIRSALKMAFDSRPEERRGEPTMVLLLTDGEAWDVQGVLKETESAVEGSKGALRVFVLGVGDQVSTNMCNAIARAGRAVASFVGEQEKPDVKLMNLLKAARGAAVTDISVDWGVPLNASDAVDSFELVDVPEVVNVGPIAPAAAQPISLFNATYAQPPAAVQLGPTEYPLSPVARVQQNDTNKIGALYPGFRTSLYAIIQQPNPSAPLPTTITVRGQVLGAPVTLEVPVTVSVASGELPANLIHVLAARNFVQELEDKSDKLGRVNALIARLGTTYGIASSQTSFVAIDEHGDVAPSAPRTIAAAAGIQSAGLFGSASTSIPFGGPSSAATTSFCSPPTFAGVAFGSAAPVQQMQQMQQMQQAPALGGMHQTSLFGARPATAAPFGQPGQMPASPGFGAGYSAAQTGGGLFGAGASGNSRLFGQQAQSGPFAQQSVAPTLVFGPPAATQGFGAAPTLFGQAAAIPAFGMPVGQTGASFFGGFGSTATNSSLSGSSPAAGGILQGPPTLESLARQQEFDGSFVPRDQYYAFLGVPGAAAAIAASLTSLNGISEQVKVNIWCTMVTIAHLMKKFDSEKDAWLLMGDKACDFVRQTLVADGRLDISRAEALMKEWLEAAMKTF
ncbi:hypothetical protein AURDEDRAFT_180436 [Auricularia subglabra TFB-10046 SS5]|nr:hypothetical protein AURDEDRAFT_180436 [Auricularia subglabra TFB-10046 SS5]